MAGWRQIAPYATWMVLMAVLPATAWAYAVRTAATLAVTVVAFGINRFTINRLNCGNESLRQVNQKSVNRKSQMAVGLAVGFLVWALWALPENVAWYRDWCILGAADAPDPSPYDPAVCGWPLTLVRLVGSAFVIAAVEEVFFRGWLYNWLGADRAAFWWTVALFALEHNRWLVGAVAGILYGLCAMRLGLGAAIVAHVTTNLVLGLQVIVTGHWSFW